MRSFLICFFFLCAIGICSVNADISPYFKKYENKSNDHTMRNIDFIYLINLDQRPEKLAWSLGQLAPYGITPFRVSAVNGWELSLEAISDIGIKFKKGTKPGPMTTYYSLDSDQKITHTHERFSTVGRTYFSHCMARGAMGCVLSHLSVLQDAYDAGYNTIWVLEDDIQVIRDPRVLSDLIAQLDQAVEKKWDILFTDVDTKNNDGKNVPCFGTCWRPNFTPANPKFFMERINLKKGSFRKIGARYGTYSMIIRRSGMKKILDFLKDGQVFLPYDIELCMVPGIRLFTVKQDVVSTLIKASSDNGGQNYLQAN